MRTRAEGTPNRGSEALKALCGDEYGAQKRLADELQADQAQFSRWVRGIRKPETPMRVKLLERHAIPLTAWDEPIEPDAPASERRGGPTPTGTEDA